MLMLSVSGACMSHLLYTHVCIHVCVLAHTSVSMQEGVSLLLVLLEASQSQECRCAEGKGTAIALSLYPLLGWN